MNASPEESTRGRRVLVFAYYFPPMGMSGVQRTLKFVKYLPEFGWEPTVVTCTPGGYFAYDGTLLEEALRADVRIERAASWDPTRLFGTEKIVAFPEESKRRKLTYLSQLFFIPDNKVGWWRPARKTALRLHEETPFDLVFSTAPPYTAHLAAAGMARSQRVPLVLDFRDDWIGNPRHTYPTPLHRRAGEYLERRALASSSRVVAVNEVIRSDLVSRNADVVSPDRAVVIPHGFDPADFESLKHPPTRSEEGVFTLLYSGVFYDVQTPDSFLRALADLVDRRPELSDRIEAVFAGLLPEFSKELARRLGIQHLVRHLGYVPHRDVIRYLVMADVLWLTVGRAEGAESISTSKLYEYFGARKPVLGLVPEGAARDALREYGAAVIVDPEAVSEISRHLEHLYALWLANRLPKPQEVFVRRFDRRRLSGRLAALFNDVLRERHENSTVQTVDAAEG